MGHSKSFLMRRNRLLYAWALLALCLSAGCLTSREIERTRHYTLYPEIHVDTAPALDLTLGIRPLFAARAYGVLMAVLDGDHQMGFRDRDQWAEPPANTVTRAVSDAIAATGRFKDVGNAADMTRPDLLLTGELRMFHENRSVSPPMAELEVRLELRPARQPGVLWAETMREAVPMEGHTPAAFAAAMNLALTSLARHAAAEIAAIEPPEENMFEITPAPRTPVPVIR